MNLKPECIACLIDRCVFECKLAIKDERTQIACMRDFCEILSKEILKNPLATPSYLGTFRDRIIKKIAKYDYYKDLKEANNKMALEILKEIRKNLETSKKDSKTFAVFDSSQQDEKLKFLIKCAIAGNAAEYGVKGNKYMENNNIKNKFFEILKKDVDLDKTIEQINKAKKILYLADNNGEIIFDIALIKFLIESKKDVTLAIKGEDIMDDFSFNDLENLKLKCQTADLNFECPIVSCGNFIGQYFESAPKEFFEKLRNADLVVAKGMANFETLEEEYEKFKIKKKTIYLLMAKCEPIAKELKVERYSLVAKIM